MINSNQVRVPKSSVSVRHVSDREQKKKQKSLTDRHLELIIRNMIHLWFSLILTPAHSKPEWINKK